MIGTKTPSRLPFRFATLPRIQVFETNEGQMLSADNNRNFPISPVFDILGMTADPWEPPSMVAYPEF
jgi:hypothetical protein